MKKRKLLILVIPFLFCAFANGQTASLQLVGTAGETYKNTSYQLDWSIGELQTETYKGIQNTLTQGFQQGKYIITAVTQMEDLDFEITAFPNPAIDYVILKIKSQKVEDLQFTFTDVNGRVLQTNKICENQQQINLNNMAAGAYFINVKSNKAVVKTFKIVKSN